MLYCLLLLSVYRLRWSNVLVKSLPHIFFTHHIRHPIWVKSYSTVFSLFPRLVIATATTFDPVVTASTRVWSFHRVSIAFFARDMQVLSALLAAPFPGWYLFDVLLLFIEILLFLLEHAKRRYFEECLSHLMNCWFLVWRACAWRLQFGTFAFTFWKLLES